MRFNGIRPNRMIGLTLAAAVGFCAVVAVPHTVKAQDEGHDRGCSAATLRGRYGVTASGIRAIFGPQTTESFVAVGTRAYDGAGSFVDSASFHGVVAGAFRGGHVGGVYTVNPDCTGTSSFVIPGTGVEVASDFVIVDGGKSVNEVVMSPATNVVTTALRRE